MQQFFQSISAFFQKVTSDGIPFWIIFIRDAVAPIFTIAGWLVVFFVWRSRKKKEHKLMRKTKAYELLQNREFSYYENIVLSFDDAISIMSSIYIQFTKLKAGDKLDKDKLIENLKAAKSVLIKNLALLKTSIIYIDAKVYVMSVDLNEKLFYLIDILSNVITNYLKGIDVQNDLSKYKVGFEETDKLRKELRLQIRDYLDLCKDMNLKGKQ